MTWVLVSGGYRSDDFVQGDAGGATRRTVVVAVSCGESWLRGLEGGSGGPQAVSADVVKAAKMSLGTCLNPR
jgi:hypothetical protein